MLRMIPNRGVGTPAPPIAVPIGASATLAKYSSRRVRVSSIVGDRKLNPKMVLTPCLPRGGMLSGLLVGYQIGGQGDCRVRIGISAWPPAVPLAPIVPVASARM